MAKESITVEIIRVPLPPPADGTSIKGKTVGDKLTLSDSAARALAAIGFVKLPASEKQSTAAKPATT